MDIPDQWMIFNFAPNLNSSALTSSHATEIKNFSKQYIVLENLVRNYLAHLEHLEHLELLKLKRQREEKVRKETRKEETFEEYNWNEIFQQRKLSTLRVLELDKYITHHNLSAMSKIMNKKDSLIEAHIAMQTFPNQNKELVEVESDEEEIEEDDDVLCEWGTVETEEVEIFCICRQPEDDRLMICCDECDEMQTVLAFQRKT